MPSPRIDRLIWLDMEMTGLDPEICVPIEVACIVTDENLVEQSSTECVIHQSEERLSVMEPIVAEMHQASGLSDRVRAATTTLEDADEQLAAFLASDFADSPGILAGNSIHTDRLFVKRYMPKTEALLHYRMIDVSTVKELVRRWYGEDALFAKKNAHTAMADIRESLAELRHYRASFFA